MMLVTNTQSEQHVIIIPSPTQQKTSSNQTSSKIKQSVIGRSSGSLQKSLISKESTVTEKTSNITTQTVASTKHQLSSLSGKTLVTSGGQILGTHLSRSVKPDGKLKRPLQAQHKLISKHSPGSDSSGVQRTVITKNPQKHLVKRFQGTDEALLEQQVAEQTQAINGATAKSYSQDSSLKCRTFTKKSHFQKSDTAKQNLMDELQKNTSSMVGTSKTNIPPLAPISPTKKLDAITQEVIQSPIDDRSNTELKRPPHQLVIQDAHGNQTTITEGQIIALPSDAIDGQPQSYVLVTLDETGNLAPLDNEALMSLDPNLNLGGDVGNMVLQIEQGAPADDNASSKAETSTTSSEMTILSTTNKDELNKKSHTGHGADVSIGNGNRIEDSDINATQTVTVKSNEIEQRSFLLTGNLVDVLNIIEAVREAKKTLKN